MGGDHPPALGKRTQVWLWRPILPGALARVNRVIAVAKSRP